MREGNQPIGTASVAQYFQRAGELMRASGGAWIVKRHGEVSLRRQFKSPFHQRPWFQVVAEVDRAEIMAKRRAGARGGGQHGGDAGQHAYIKGLKPWRLI